MSSFDDRPAPLASAIGARVRARRNEFRVTRDDLAATGATLGMTWGRTSIENIEAGRFAPTLQTLYVLCRALTSHARDKNVTLLDLLPEDGLVEIGDGFHIPATTLRNFVGDDGVETVGDWYHEWIRTLNGPLRKRTLAEERVAKRLGIDMQRLDELSYGLAGESFEELVRHRLEPNSSPQSRGHVTRHWEQKIREYMEFLGPESG